MSGPASRRLKTHVAETGYVYEYYFVEKRVAADSPGNEYLFEASRDRKTGFPVSVVLRHDALAAWAMAHGRELSDNEQYAAAKLGLLKTFDELAEIRERKLLIVDAAILEEVLEPLDLA